MERNSSNFSYISFFDMNFENLTVKFYVPYVLNMHIEFRSNRMLFTIWSINLFFIHNFRLQKLKILIFVWWYSNWFLIILKLCMKNIIRTCNWMVRFSKFTLNIYKDIWRVWRIFLQTSLKKNFIQFYFLSLFTPTKKSHSLFLFPSPIFHHLSFHPTNIG